MPLRYLGLALLLLLTLAPAAHADSLPASVAQALRNAQVPPGSVAVVVQGVDQRSAAIAHNGPVSMNPASVMKLVTTYAALDLLGPAGTWKTTAWVDSEPTEGRVNGSLYLKGSGDPKLSLEQFWLLLRQLRQRGIKDIQGDLVIDRSLFNLPLHDPGAFDDKPLRPYNVGPDALLVNFRAQRYTLVPGNGRVQILTDTPSEGLRIENRIQLSQDGCGDWKERLNIRLLPDAQGNRLDISGNYALDCGERALNLSLLPADVQVEGLFRALWRELGGSLRGKARSGNLPASAVMVAQQESPAVADVVRDINKFSNNVMARQLFLTLGNNGRQSSLEGAKARVGEWLNNKGLRFPELEIENGSGLSRRERISADSLNRMLQDAWRSPVMPEFIASMPIVGVDGTMKKRLKSSEASGRAHIKTGTLEGVKTAAGYALDDQGRNYVVVFFANHPRAHLTQPAIDALLLWIAQGQASKKLAPE